MDADAMKQFISDLRLAWKIFRWRSSTREEYRAGGLSPMRKLKVSDLKLIWTSPVSDPSDFINCEVRFQDLYAFELRFESSTDTVEVVFGVDGDIGAISVEDFISAVTIAKERYVKRLKDGPAPGALGYSN